MALKLSRPPKDDEELWWLIKAMVGVELPRVSVCPDHVSPFDAVAHAYFGREPNFAVWYASRGSGKSLALAVLGLVKALTLDVDVTILGGSMTQSLNVREHMRKLMAHPNFPRYAVDKDIATLIEMKTGRQVRPLPASETTVRGPHPPLQLLDEIDEMDYGIYNSSLGQAMEQMNHLGQTIQEYIVASSTWQNPEGTMTKVIDDARQRGLPVFTWCWRELLEPHGWMTQRFIDNKRRTVSAQMWHCLPGDQEVDTARGPVPCQQIAPGDQVWTRKGWRPVTALVRQPEAPIYQVTTTDGRSYRATGNHPVATPSGWVLTQDRGLGQALVTSDPAHVLPFARQADAMPLGVDAPLGRSGVSAHTDAGIGTTTQAVDDVLAVGEQSQMARVDASGPVAGVVDGHPGWYLSEPGGVGHPVGVVDASDGAHPVAVLARGAGPEPAVPVIDAAFADVGLQVGDAPTSVCHVDSVRRLPPEVVWDISVGETHEFTVNGIVTHNTEYELNEPAAGGRALDLDKVAEYFLQPDEYGETIREVHKGNGNHDVYVWEEPETGASYAVGADWAKEQDKTVISVVRYDTKPYRLVKLTRVNRLPWGEMISMFNGDIRHYQAVGYHDKTGLGSVVNDYVDFSDTTKGFVMVGRPRTQLLLDYITSFEHGDYRLPHIPKRDTSSGIAENPTYRAHRSVTVADVYAPSKWNTHLPDDFASMALLHRAISTLPQPTTETGEVRKDGTVRDVDKPFHVFDQDRRVNSEGDVTVVDERYGGASDFIVTDDGSRDPWEAMNV